jgi:glycerol-3-phosphate acyltransferase PlsY
MIETLIFIALMIITYFIGCCSTAKVLAKTYKSMNIYKVGTGHPDTQNIYYNIDKTLGIMTGVLDVGKVFFVLVIIKYLLTSSYMNSLLPDLEKITSLDHFLILGFLMIVGHCLPLTHKFQGGRGIFTYIGFVIFFTPWAMIIVAILAFLVYIIFNQMRFAQYMTVLLPPFVNFFFKQSPIFPDFPHIALIGRMFIVAILMGIINYFVSKRLGEI